MTHDPDVEVLARQLALQLRSEWGEELPTAVDEVLSPGTDPEEVYDLATILAVAALIVQCAQFIIQIVDRRPKSNSSKSSDDDLREQVTKKLKAECPEQIKLVPDFESIVTVAIAVKKSSDKD